MENQKPLARNVLTLAYPMVPLPGCYNLTSVDPFNDDIRLPFYQLCKGGFRNATKDILKWLSEGVSRLVSIVS
jgi:hypothetical protein